MSVVELYWVLTSCYGLSDAQAASALEAVIRTRQFVVERADVVVRTLRVFQAGKSDWPDCLIERSAAHAGCSRTVTFDEHAARRAGMALL